MGFDRAGSGAWLASDLGTGLARDAGQRGVAGRLNLDEARPDVLPVFPSHLVAGMMQRLSPQDRELALKHKLLPAAVLPGMTVYAAATPAAERAARERGLRVVARVDGQAFRKALRLVLGPSLLREAVYGLARRTPEYSAERRVTGGQVFGALVLAAAITGLGEGLDWGYVLLLASLLAGLFFAMTVAIRVFALLPGAVLRPASAAPLPTAALPTYSVLVPLFRETAVLRQLASGLMALDYPALCIKRTKR